MNYPGRAFANDEGSADALEVICKAFSRGNGVCADKNVNITCVSAPSRVWPNLVFRFRPVPSGQKITQGTGLSLTGTDTQTENLVFVLPPLVTCAPSESPQFGF